jgi:hypothetical protein
VQVITGIVIEKLSRRASPTRPRRKQKTAKAKRTPASRVRRWEHVRYRVRHTPDYIIKGTDHIEVVVISPKKEPLPITETGYLSHFITDGSCRTVDAAVAFFAAWLDREAKTKRWQKLDQKRRQLDLFR